MAEDLAVLGVYGPVGLVHDHQVEVSGVEAGALAGGLLDEAEHGGVGGGVDASFPAPVLQHVHGGAGEAVLHEGVRGLLHEGLPVREEEHALDPSGAGHLVHQGDGGARLAGAGGHHQQSGAALVLEGISVCDEGSPPVPCVRESHTCRRPLLIRWVPVYVPRGSVAGCPSRT